MIYMVVSSLIGGYAKSRIGRDADREYTVRKFPKARERIKARRAERWVLTEKRKTLQTTGRSKSKERFLIGDNKNNTLITTDPNEELKLTDRHGTD